MLYVRSDLSLLEIARLLKGLRGASFSTIGKRSKREGWPALRERFRERRYEEQAALIVHRDAEEAAERGRRLLKLAHELQEVGRSLMAAAAHGFRKLGGIEGVLTGEGIQAKDVVYAARAGADVTAKGVQIEHELTGGAVSSRLIPRIEIQLLSAETEQDGGNN